MNPRDMNRTPAARAGIRYTGKPGRPDRTAGCGCGLPIYVHEENALAAAGERERARDVVRVYRCPASAAWHVAPDDGLPPEVLESTGRHLAYHLLTNPTTDLDSYRKDVLGLDPEADRNRWRKIRSRYCLPMISAGVIFEDLDEGDPTGILHLANADAANRIVQVGLDRYLEENGLPLPR